MASGRRPRSSTDVDTSFDGLSYNSYRRRENVYQVDRRFPQRAAPTIPPRDVPSPVSRTSRPDWTESFRSITQDDDEELYISTSEIETFPTRPAPSPFKNRPASVHNTRKGNPPIYRATTRINTRAQTISETDSHLAPEPIQDNLYTAVNKKKTPKVSLDENFLQYSPGNASADVNSSWEYKEPGRQKSTETNGRPTVTAPDMHRQHSYRASEQNQPLTSETAIYGIGQGRKSNMLMDYKKIQSKLMKLYYKIEANADCPQVYELKMHLRLSEHTSAETLSSHIYKTLAPPNTPQEPSDSNDKNLYIVDFHEFENKSTLRQQLIEMFAQPGPPSISYQKVDAKMDSIITEFCQRTEDLRLHRNEMVQSPAHARSVMTGIQDAEQLVKALRDNELWIRWGTASFLPPLSHLYMHKHPPYYEVRKAVTLSFVAERRRSAPDTFRSITSPQSLCPPIYGRLKDPNSNEIKWQVTEFNDSSGKFENRECQLPTWLNEDSLAWSVIHSSNRGTFPKGEHPYALYSVYLVIVKDFSLGQENDGSLGMEKEQFATPSKYQFYVNSSTTGVLYRFTIANSHCERMYQALQDAPTLRHFRCYEGCDLVEACLALSWLRRQPRAVFVLNSFLATSMSSLSLERKKPFHERMTTLQRHLTNGKKLGPLFDMRYGMNGTTTINQEDE